MARRVPWRHLAPLLALVFAAFLVVGACGDDGDGGDALPSGVTPAPATFAASIDACDLIRNDELVRFLGSDPINASGDQTEDIAFCTWPGEYEGNISSVSLQITTSPVGFDALKNEPGYAPLQGVGEEAHMQTVDGLPTGLLNNNIVARDGIYYVLLAVGSPLERNEVREEMPIILRRILRELP